ncbi:hypothetical protein A0H81_14272 [Grifola frondosa]|uniref:Uncharacterized protein n=1 Tax=Grifola frondosa TaxID=5627 RepID=A0A1C7LNY4_GRIFR|nr:hypothetical protein A0H81_14272 [Grifola frondosa]
MTPWNPIADTLCSCLEDILIAGQRQAFLAPRKGFAQCGRTSWRWLNLLRLGSSIICWIMPGHLAMADLWQNAQHVQLSEDPRHESRALAAKPVNAERLGETVGWEHALVGSQGL